MSITTRSDQLLFYMRRFIDYTIGIMEAAGMAGVSKLKATVPVVPDAAIIGYAIDFDANISADMIKVKDMTVMTCLASQWCPVSSGVELGQAISKIVEFIEADQQAKDKIFRYAELIKRLVNTN